MRDFLTATQHWYVTWPTELCRRLNSECCRVIMEATNGSAERLCCQEKTAHDRRDREKTDGGVLTEQSALVQAGEEEQRMVTDSQGGIRHASEHLLNPIPKIFFEGDGGQMNEI
ncbi:uncharacterized protein LOC144510381 [Mustelus asterias]